MKLNPMAEILNLWDDQPNKNILKYLPLHPLQNSVNSKRLFSELERVAVESVNLVGVDLN